MRCSCSCVFLFSDISVAGKQLLKMEGLGNEPNLPSNFQRNDVRYFPKKNSQDVIITPIQ